MTTIAEAALSDAERRAVEGAVEALRDELGEELASVWLYGSRARGEAPGPESDIDLVVVVEPGPRAPYREAKIVQAAAERAGANPFFFSVQVYDTERLAQRREIKSFFIQEVDRDKIVLHGQL